MLLIAFLILFVVGAIGSGGAALAWLAGVALFGMVAGGLTYLSLALTLRCESCDKRLFIEGAESRYPKATKIKGFDYWASAVIEVIRSQRLTCMHCGQRYALSATALSDKKP